MTHAYFSIPSATVPDKIFKLGVGIYCFNTSDNLGYANLAQNAIGVLINIHQNADYKKILSEIISILNVLRWENSAIKYLSELDYKEHLIKVENETEWIEGKIRSKTNGYSHVEDFSGMYVHSLTPAKIKFSFVDLFIKLHTLDKTNIMHSLIHYFSTIHYNNVHLNRIYSSAFQEPAFYIQILEAYLTKLYPVNHESIKACESCGKPTNVVGLKTRIQKLLDDNKIENTEFRKSILIHLASRNRFFHALKSTTTFEYIDLMLKTTGGNYISPSQDLKDAYGTTIAVGTLRIFLILILCNKLLEEN